MVASSRRILASFAAVCVLIGPGVCGAVCGVGVDAIAAAVAPAGDDHASMPCHAAPESTPEAPTDSERTTPDCCEPDFEQAFLSTDAPKAEPRPSQPAAPPLGARGPVATPSRVALGGAAPLAQGASAHRQTNPPLLI